MCFFNINGTDVAISQLNVSVMLEIRLNFLACDSQNIFWSLFLESSTLLLVEPKDIFILENPQLGGSALERFYCRLCGMSVATRLDAMALHAEKHQKNKYFSVGIFPIQVNGKTGINDGCYQPDTHSCSEKKKMSRISSACKLVKVHIPSDVPRVGGKIFCRKCMKHPITLPDAKNIIDVRWVRKWKKDAVTLEKFIKSRLTVRGFKDTCQDLETYAGTATRWAQRLIVALAVLLDLPMFTIDVTGAFAKGLNWEQLAELTGESIREVQFELTRPEDIALLRQLPGLADVDPASEVLQMTKAIYGLKDAPRAWRKRLHQILVEAGMRQLKSEMELYVSNEALKGQPTTADTRNAPRGCLPVQG